MERTKSTTQLINSGEKEEFLLLIAKDIKSGNIESTNIRLDTLERKENLEWLKEYSSHNSKSETLLHLAVKKLDDISFIRKLAELCSQSLTSQVKDHEKFCGQTVLHISITKGNAEMTKTLLDIVHQKENDKMSELLQLTATGGRFVNTVGQLPLSVAALTGNTKIVDILIHYGAILHAQNGEGDTVFHSIVKYAAIYPEKVMAIIQMFRYLTGKPESKYIKSTQP